MKRAILIATLSVVGAALPVSGQVETSRSVPTELDARLNKLLVDADVPGISVAGIEGGQVAWIGAYGVTDANSGAAVTNETVFEAASLSKPVVGYIASRLAARGELDLDAPLWESGGYERLEHDPRAQNVTARMVLSHTSGLPNWGGTPLEMNFDPGTSWNYSGEGYVWLATTLERSTGLSLNELAEREVFEPLGMTRSSYVWRDDYEQLSATPHDITGRPVQKNKPRDANAAASLHTTASDYARFVVAVMAGEGLPNDVATEMLSAQSQIGGWGSQDTFEYLDWGLGWGLQKGERAPAIWHWGDNGNFRCFVIAYPSLGEGFVYFTNSNNGLAITDDLLNLLYDDERWAVRYLDYQTWDQPRRQIRIGLRKSFAGGDSPEGWVALEEAAEALPANQAENEVRGLGGYLAQSGQAGLAVRVIEWGAKRFETAESYRALGQAHTDNGDYEAALAAFDRAISMNGSLQAALASRIEWLREGVDAAAVEYQPTAEELGTYVGEYGPRRIQLEGAGLMYSRDGGTPRSLTPMAEDLFALDGNASFRMRFERDAQGQVVAIIGLYADGRTDRSPRSN